MLRKLKNEAEIAMRHLQVLETVMENQPIGIFKLAGILNMPKHKVRYSLRVLEHSGIIEPTQHGARIRKDAKSSIERLKEDLEDVKMYIREIEKRSSKL